MSEFNFFNVIRSLYTKNTNSETISQELCPTLIKWLSFDKTTIRYLKTLIPFLFYIEPQHFYYLLFFTLPKSSVPYFKKKDIKKEQEEKKLVEKIQYILNWSDRELQFHKNVIQKLILPNKKYWCEEFGL